MKRKEPYGFVRRRRVPALKDESLVFDYKEPEKLATYVSDRGKIVGRGYTGLSAKQQRQLAKAVKRARFLALLPYSQQV